MCSYDDTRAVPMIYKVLYEMQGQCDLTTRLQAKPHSSQIVRSAILVRIGTASSDDREIAIEERDAICARRERMRQKLLGGRRGGKGVSQVRKHIAHE